MSVKKSMFILVSVMMLTVLCAASAFAAPAKAAATAMNIGIVDRMEIANNHPRANDVRQQIASIYRQKEEEAKAAADKESDPAKKAQAVQSKRMELAQEEQKIMEPIYSDCQKAIREVAVKQKLDLVLEKAVVLIGGKDITQDVIQQLAKTKGK